MRDRNTKDWVASQEQLNDIAHALGSSQTPQLNKMGWRNHYFTHEELPHLNELVDRGFMVRQGPCYHVTEQGARLIGMTERRINFLRMPVGKVKE